MFYSFLVETVGSSFFSYIWYAAATTKTVWCSKKRWVKHGFPRLSLSLSLSRATHVSSYTVLHTQQRWRFFSTAPAALVCDEFPPANSMWRVPRANNMYFLKRVITMRRAGETVYMGNRGGVVVRHWHCIFCPLFSPLSPFILFSA